MRTTKHSVQSSLLSLLQNLTLLEHLRNMRSENVTVVTVSPEILHTTASVDKIISPILYVFGFPGNILSCILWMRPRMRHSSGIYLTALGFVDLTFLLLHVLFEFHKVWNIGLFDKPVWCETIPILFMSAQYLSPLLVLAFTVERFIGVLFPSKRQTFCTPKRARVVSICLALFSLSLGSVQGYFYTYSTKYKFCGIREEAFRGGHRSFWSVWSWCTEMLVFFCVPVTILVLNITIIRQVQRLAEFEHTVKARAMTTTFSLLVVSFYFIITTFPVSIVYAIRYSYMPAEDGTLSQIDANRQANYTLAKTIIDEIGMTHHACKFYIFILTEKLFREEFVHVMTSLITHRRRNKMGYIPQTEATANTEWVATETVDGYKPEETNM